MMKKLTENQKMIMGVLSSDKERVFTAKEISDKTDGVLKSRGIASPMKALIENKHVERIEQKPVGYKYMSDVVIAEPKEEPKVEKVEEKPEIDTEKATDDLLSDLGIE